MNNSFWIITIKIIIIKATIIKIYISKTRIIIKKSNIMKICINKDYIVIKKKPSLSRFLSTLFQKSN